jgi:YgiT-type zinc finger domain-containing protein
MDKFSKKEASFMKCVICHGEDIRKTEVDEEIRYNGNIILFPIKTLVCQTCGEKYYDRFTMQKLEKAEEEIRNKKRKLKEAGRMLQVSA